MDSGDSGSEYNCEPLWTHVDILEESGLHDEDTVKFLCDYCNRAFHGNYSTVEAHLLESSGSDVEACRGLTDTIRAQLENEFAAAKKSNARTMSPSAASSYSSGMSVTGKAIIQPMKRKKSVDLDDGLYEKSRKLLDAMIAKMFYSSG
jgi:hypothetical protein